MTFEQAYNTFKEQVVAVTAGGADIISFETFTDVSEMRIALLAAKENCNLPVICSISYEQNGRTLMGSDPAVCAYILHSLGADMIGTNCSFGPEYMLKVAEIYGKTGLSFSIKPNAGIPKTVDGKLVYDETSEKFAKYTREFIKNGARLVGGCCGTRPEFIAEISKIVRESDAVSYPLNVDFITSSSKAISFEDIKQTDIGWIDIKIEETLKKDLLAGDMSAITDTAMDLMEEDYELIAIDVDVPEADELLLANVVKEAQTYLKQPFILKSDNPKSLEAALRVYKGRAGVITKASDCVDEILNKYGAVNVGGFILNENNYFNSLVRYLVEKDYYHLISADNQVPDLSNGIASMIRDIQGTSVFVEIIDADRYTIEQISNIMLNGAAMLNNIQGSNAYIFKVFLFESTTDMDKVEIIKQHQVDITLEKRFMKCISLNISEKKVEKYFSVPAFDAGLVKSFKRFFSKDIDKRETSYKDIEGVIERRKKDFEIQFKAQKPWLTYIIIALNIFMYGLLQLVAMKTGTVYEQQLEPFGAKVNNLIMDGQYWRFITPMFLHADIVHLAVNCYSIYIIGTQVEKIFGRGRFLAIYFVSGLIGSAASFAFSLNSSVGASGAIFGLVGAMLYFSLGRPALLKSSYGVNLVTMTIINIAYGFMNKRIDNHAHIGGLIGGFLTAGAVYLAQEKNKKSLLKKVTSILLVVAITVGTLFYGFNNDINVLSPKLAALEQFDIQNNWIESEEKAKEILGLNPADKDIKIRVFWSLIRLK